MPRTIAPWRDGDTRAHCTHCSCCGYLFRTDEILIHINEAHLGSRENEMKHLRDGARLFAMCVRIDTEEYTDQELLQYSLDSANWLNAEETRQKTVRGDGTFHPTGVLP